ncbi:hypothetical protein [Sphingomonas baiyangensis]|uniref:Uncharacterized protein n=1 Tax=Sphingomonas baiyangensis TaxID=2572576 RepID=A0A4U1L0N4_9SPHN|nr:hypothetical protein [Sphingomonas baiyangensis]TKD50307.1 hypothetical protein FBR43_05690 [Sphingomonas baiyangensis]
MNLLPLLYALLAAMTGIVMPGASAAERQLSAPAALAVGAQAQKVAALAISARASAAAPFEHLRPTPIALEIASPAATRLIDQPRDRLTGRRRE